MPKCYMCDNESVSREHAPPQGFFPVGHRNDLITVPSCIAHNEDTSPDDEYVRNIITTSIENNQVSIDHFFDKSYRSYKRNPQLVNPIVNTLKDVSEYKENAQAYQFDRPRFDRIIRKIAYALFYKEFGFTWERELAVTTNQIKMPDMTNDHLGDLFETLVDDLDELILKGSNPLVFQYSFIQYKEGKFDQALFMIFYEGFPFWIIPDSNTTQATFD